MPISLDLLTPIKPHKLEQLFSPRNQSLRIQTPTSHLRRLSNDVTYQVDPITKQPKVPIENYECYHDDDDELNLNNSESCHFPRTSTGIKGPRPQFIESVASESNLITTINNIQLDVNDDDYIPQYKPIQQITDDQPIRATCFHPSGEVYVVGTNSKKLGIYFYPTEQDFKHFSIAAYDEDLKNYYPIQPEYSFQFQLLHRSSVYCASFNGSGSLLATGSNDQTIHVIQYDSQKHEPKSNEYKLTGLHNGTVRDLMFMQSESNENASLLISAGAGLNNVCITDCNDGMKTVRVLTGHESAVMSLHRWEDRNMFVSGSLDGTIRMWDIRSNLCLKVIDTNKLIGPNEDPTSKSGVNVVRVEQTGRLLASGHKDGRCMLYDIKAGRVVQSFKQHEAEIRTLNFSPKSYYLLTAGYDNKIKLMDFQGELGSKLPCVDIGVSKDKIVQTSWHPIDYNFITTCADGSATLWAIPEKPRSS